MILPILVIAPSEKGGRGVFTTEPIEAGTVIEISPVLVLNEADRKEAEKTILHYYIFEWGEDTDKEACIGMGYISMYNHDYHANCDYDMDYESQLMSIRTVKDVGAGEELFINYNASPDDETRIGWFEAV